MFKRVEKRRRKKEEEEELGLDEDMKQILGMHDTDSEESDSDEDSSGDDSEDGLGGLEGLGADSELEGDDEFGDEEGVPLDDGSESEEEAPKDLNPHIPISKALQDPIYLDLVDPMVKLCLVCTGKRLKTENLVEVHRSSNAHQRRVKQFKKHVEEKDADPLGDAFTFIHEVLPKGPVVVSAPKPLPEASGKSNRALKKERAKELRKAKRDKAKERRAKKVTPGEKSEKPASVPDKANKRAKEAKVADEQPASQGQDDEDTRPKKKARIETGKSGLTPDPSSPPEKKTKNRKAAVTSPAKDAPSAVAALTTAPSTDPRAAVRTSLADTIKNIARSATDRAKSARTKASSTTSPKTKAKRPKAKSKT